MVAAGRAKRVGLVATSSIRGGTNLPVLQKIASEHVIHDAWGELPWVIDGANVEVSLICFSRTDLAPAERHLDGKTVQNINPDLTSGPDLTRAMPLSENDDVSFLGIQKSGPLDVPGYLARRWMALPENPNGRNNCEILKPYWNGDDLTSRPRDVWLIDFPLKLSESEAALFEAPFEYLRTARYDPDDPNDLRTLQQARAEARDDHARNRWWEPYWPRPEMRQLIENLRRYIVTAETAEHRIFVWLSYPVLPDKNLIVIARDDDTTFGILQSRVHELWALRKGTSLEDRPRYTSTTTFCTFPFPEGLAPNIPATTYERDTRATAIAKAARTLNESRDRWLNPADMVRRVREAGRGFPDRLEVRGKGAEEKIKERTLTALYNSQPQWLIEAHRELDYAVARAYGWQTNLTDDEILTRLLELNLARAS